VDRNEYIGRKVDKCIDGNINEYTDGITGKYWEHIMGDIRDTVWPVPREKLTKLSNSNKHE
jgi:hypothetical protein